MSDDVLLERRREINRRAATKSRKKQRERAVNIKQKYHEELSKNTKQNYEKTILTKQRDSLRELLREHQKVCSNPESLPKEISKPVYISSSDSEEADGMGFSCESESDSDSNGGHPKRKVLRGSDADLGPSCISGLLSMTEDIRHFREISRNADDEIPDFLNRSGRSEKGPKVVERKSTLSQVIFCRSTSCPASSTDSLTTSVALLQDLGDSSTPGFISSVLPSISSQLNLPSTECELYDLNEDPLFPDIRIDPVSETTFGKWSNSSDLIEYRRNTFMPDSSCGYRSLVAGLESRLKIGSKDPVDINKVEPDLTDSSWESIIKKSDRRPITNSDEEPINRIKHDLEHCQSEDDPKPLIESLNDYEIYSDSTFDEIKDYEIKDFLTSMCQEENFTQSLERNTSNIEDVPVEIRLDLSRKANNRVASCETSSWEAKKDGDIVAQAVFTNDTPQLGRGLQSYSIAESNAAVDETRDSLDQYLSEGQPWSDLENPLEIFGFQCYASNNSTNVNKSDLASHHSERDRFLYPFFNSEQMETGGAEYESELKKDQAYMIDAALSKQSIFNDNKRRHSSTSSINDRGRSLRRSFQFPLPNASAWRVNQEDVEFEPTASFDRDAGGMYFNPDEGLGSPFSETSARNLKSRSWDFLTDANQVDTEERANKFQKRIDHDLIEVVNDLIDIEPPVVSNLPVPFLHERKHKLIPRDRLLPSTTFRRRNVERASYAPVASSDVDFGRFVSDARQPSMHLYDCIYEPEMFTSNAADLLGGQQQPHEPQMRLSRDNITDRGSDLETMSNIYMPALPETVASPSVLEISERNVSNMSNMSNTAQLNWSALRKQALPESRNETRSAYSIRGHSVSAPSLFSKSSSQNKQKDVIAEPVILRGDYRAKDATRRGTASEKFKSLQHHHYPGFSDTTRLNSNGPSPVNRYESLAAKSHPTHKISAPKYQVHRPSKSFSNFEPIPETALIEKSAHGQLDPLASDNSFYYDVYSTWTHSPNYRVRGNLRNPSPACTKIVYTPKRQMSNNPRSMELYPPVCDSGNETLSDVSNPDLVYR